jgi:hypothetical protein
MYNHTRPFIQLLFTATSSMKLNFHFDPQITNFTIYVKIKRMLEELAMQLE